MFAALLGVASFHRACLLAQDFTHEPACQTGERAPQGRFRHQPEQMVHPPFAWQLADARRDNLTASGVITSRKNGLRILQ